MSKATLDRLIGHHTKYSSQFQDREINTRSNGPTLFGMLEQASRELARRWLGLKHLIVGRQHLEIDIEELEFELRPDTQLSEFDYRRRLLTLAEKRAALEECDRSFNATKEAFWEFYGQCLSLEEALDIKGPLTPKQRAAFDREKWKAKTISAALIDMVGNRRLGQDVVETLALFPAEWRQEAVGTLVEAGLVNNKAPNGQMSHADSLLRLLDFMAKRQTELPARNDNGRPQLEAGHDIRALLGEVT